MVAPLTWSALPGPCRHRHTRLAGRGRCAATGAENRGRSGAGARLRTGGCDRTSTADSASACSHPAMRCGAPTPDPLFTLGDSPKRDAATTVLNLPPAQARRPCTREPIRSAGQHDHCASPPPSRSKDYPKGNRRQGAVTILQGAVRTLSGAKVIFAAQVLHYFPAFCVNPSS